MNDLMADFLRRRNSYMPNPATQRQALFDNAPVGSVGMPGGLLTGEEKKPEGVGLGGLLGAGAMLPGPAGDVLGPLADAYMYATDPSSRKPSNYALSLAGLLPGMVSATVFHGSPHKFDAFDATRAGQEGGASFGMGHNFSADAKHAEVYAKREGAGNLYKVDLSDEAIETMLRWEKPLDQQTPAAQELAKTVAGALPEKVPFGGGAFINTKGGSVRLEFPGGSGFNLSQSDYKRMFGDAGTGEQIYRRLVAKLGDEKAANEALRRAGVRGIENNIERDAQNFVLFPGEESALQILERNGQGTSNYVVFDDKLPKILKRE
jgi:hypothetical protein